MGNGVPDRALTGEDRHAADLLLKRVRSEIASGVKRGLSFADAADRAGVHHTLAINIKDDDPELSELYEISKDRPRVQGEISKSEITPLEIKHGYLRDLADAGLFRKSVEMVRRADIEDERGARVISGHLQYVAKELWPKESQAKVEKKEIKESDQLTDEQLVRLIEKRREQRLTKMAVIQDAQKALSERVNESKGG